MTGRSETALCRDWETSKLDKTIEKLERYAEFLEGKSKKKKTAQAGSKEIL